MNFLSKTRLPASENHTRSHLPHRLQHRSWEVKKPRSCADSFGWVLRLAPDAAAVEVELSAALKSGLAGELESELAGSYVNFPGSVFPITSRQLWAASPSTRQFIKYWDTNNPNTRLGANRAYLLAPSRGLGLIRCPNTL